MKSIRMLLQQIIALLLLAVIALSPQHYAAAAGAVSLELTATESDQEVVVTVTGKNLTDLYAYELMLKADPLRLALTGAKSGITGFTVGTKVQGDEVRFAHTKTGPTSGVKGTAVLAVLTFERIRGGDTAIELVLGKLIDSKLDQVEVSPNVRAQLTGGQPTAELSDIAGHWAEAAIAEATDLGFVAGYPDGTFRPQQQVTREEFTAMLVRALLLPSSEDGSLAFADRGDISAWAAGPIGAAVGAGWINGYGDGTFKGKHTIVRQEMAAIVVRAMGIGPPPSESDSAFADNGRIAPWARAYAAAALEAGVMRGKGGNQFAPLDNATRAEAVTVILNVLREIGSDLHVLDK